MALSKPNLIDRDASVIVQECIAFYEAATGKILQPAQPERMVINMFAYREVLLRNEAQNAALQNLVSFSSFPVLDELGKNVGVTRLPASSAEVKITFSLVAGHGDIVLPQGTRVSSTDGKVVFQTKDAFSILIADSDVDVDCICVQPGIIGNGYLVNTIVNILDPLPFLESASNDSTTAGGSDEETDDQLRERIILAPSAFSSAGPEDAYKFFARTAHPSIIDVGITSITPGTVQIYPLVEGGISTPAPILADVLAICSAKKVRPLNDIVTSASPTSIAYDINVELLLYEDANQTDIETTVNASLADFTLNKIQKLGRDIIVNQIIGLCQVTGVYKVNVISPIADIIINETSFGKCGITTVTTTGFTNG